MRENSINLEIQKVVNLYKNQNFKEALLEAHLTKSKYQQLENSNFYLNLVGLINLALKDWENSIFFFDKAIQSDPKILDPYFNLGIAYYDMGELMKSLDFFLKVYKSSNDKKSKFAIIKLLSHINPINQLSNNLIDINDKIQKIDSKINLKEKIKDEFISDIIDKCKSKAQKIDNFEFNEDQVFRRNEIDLNCERHKRIFFKYNTIPKFCFSCIKIVIYLENPFDLIKLVLFFDQFKNLSFFNRKCMIDKRQESFKGYIYFDSIETAKKLSKEITPIIEVLLGKKFKQEIKRGCSEFAIKYPNYKDINYKIKYPKEWSNNEEKSDMDNFKDGIPITRNMHKSLSGLTLSDFLIFNKWLNLTKPERIKQDK
tara:strand:- start:58 stop:1167 length:1110 start_codon:yes stop_codon:yes gene_type:complete